MADQTDNHEFNKPVPWDQGVEDEDVWGDQLNENFDKLENRVTIRDAESQLNNYTPTNGVEFVATDTGAVYQGDGSSWNKAHRQFSSATDGRLGDTYVVYSDGSDWVAVSSSDTNTVSSPGAALQYAADNGGEVHLVDNVPTDDPITQTVDLGGSELIGPGSREAAAVYVDGEQTNIGFKKTSGGHVRDLHLRGDPDAASATFTNVDLLWLQDMGRGSLVDNVSTFGTRGNGIVVAGCQQMVFRSITTSTCGSPSNDTWHIYLTNSPSQSLGANSCNWIDVQRHGSGGVDGGWIAMRADQNADGKYPRNMHFWGLHGENGPTDTSTPLIELEERSHSFVGGRLNNIDQASSIFQVAGGDGRSIRNIISNFRVVAPNNGTNFYDANGIAAAVPTISNCYIDVDGTGIILDNHNQANRPLLLNNVDFSGTPTILDVTASKDAGEPIALDNVYGTGNISVQGSRLYVSNVPGASWTSQGAEFGPRLRSNDGSFPYTTFTANTANGTGVAEKNFSGDFELIDGHVSANTSRGDSVIVVGTELFDSNGDGDLDTVRAEVRTLSDLTVDAADGKAVKFKISPS